MALRVGIMGGTFDPIHHGHLVAASEVASRFDLDEVVFVPTGEPYHKDRHVSTAEHRYLMGVSRVDIDRGGPTYTVDTIHDIAAIRPGAELFFITGADALAQILSWHQAEDALKLARFVGVTRPGYDLSDAHLPVDTVQLVDVPAMAISSSDVRSRVAAGNPIWYLVPRYRRCSLMYCTIPSGTR